MCLRHLVYAAAASRYRPFLNAAFPFSFAVEAASISVVPAAQRVRSSPTYTSRRGVTNVAIMRAVATRQSVKMQALRPRRMKGDDAATQLPVVRVSVWTGRP